MDPTPVAVAAFGGRRVPRPLRGLTRIDPVGGLDRILSCRRVVVIGSEADLASVLSRLLRADRLDVEVAHVRRRWQARGARTRTATRVPLIRDETGTVLVRSALWLPAEEARAIRGEAIVDDTVLFDGDAPAVRIEPTATMPGLRAAVVSGRMRRKRWVSGRAAQLGTTGARVIRDGEPAARAVRRSSFYRHTHGWLRV